MTWFRVDDQFEEHRKTRRLGADRLPAMGLWVACGSWAGRNLSDGFVPDEVVTRYDAEHRYAQRLCDVDLWRRSSLDGEDGYEFHQWDEHQPSREAVQKKREDTRRRVAEHRARKAAEQEQQGSSQEPAEEEAVPDDELSNASNALLSSEGNDAGNAAPDPTRPDPSFKKTAVDTSEEKSPSSGGSGGRASRKRSASSDPQGHRLPDDWWPTEQDREWFRQNCPDLEGRGTALTEEFRDYWHSKAGKEARKTDWSKTWKNRMRDRQDQAKNRRPTATAGRVRESTTDVGVASVQALKRSDDHQPPSAQTQLRLAAGGP